MATAALIAWVIGNALDKRSTLCQPQRVFGLEWTPAAWCLLAAFAVLAIAGSALAYILTTSGRTRAMTSDELTDRMMRYDPSDYPNVATSHGAGVRRESTVNIDTLRQIAKRGEWLLFWCWPIMLSGFFGGIQLLSTAALLFLAKPQVALIVNLCFAPVTLFGWFFAWAALYTNIDAGADPEP